MVFLCIYGHSRDSGGQTGPVIIRSCDNPDKSVTIRSRDVPEFR